jgi:hypothetical protein
MKYIVYLLLLSLTIVSCSPRKFNLKANKFSFREQKNEEWSQFSDWQEVNYKVVLKKTLFRKNSKTLTIYDDKPVTYKIVEENDESKTEKGESIISYNCVDSEGDKCVLILIDKGPSVNLVVYYSNVNYCYNIIEEK